jgi:hypothetical protein
MARHNAYAESLREQVLQDLFAMRRNLELTTGSSFDGGEGRVQGLGAIEQVVASLDKLTQSLYPAYIDDSLPLALQYQAEVWRRRMPQLQLSVSVPQQWRSSCPYYNWLMLALLDEWLLALSAKSDITASVAIALAEDESTQWLNIEFQAQPLARLASAPEIPVHHLIILFETMLAGQFTTETVGFQTTWQFYWRPSSTTVLTPQ